MSDTTLFASLQPFLVTATPAALGPGPRAGVRSADDLNSALAAVLVRHSRPPRQRELIRALLLLWHDHHEEAHAIVQTMEGNSDADCIHAILHRREPDHGNARYWFRRVGAHPCFTSLAASVATLLKEKNEPALAMKLLPEGRWDASAFNDACASSGQTIARATLEQIQAAEFAALLECLCMED